MIAIDDITEKYGAEHALVLLVCRSFLGAVDDAEVNSFIKHNTIDWEYFYHVAIRNRIRPICYQVLSKTDIPNDVHDKLQEDNKRISLKSIEHLKEFLFISSALKKQDIQILPYKGLVMSAAYYPNFHLREFSDIDFLINLKDDTDINKLSDFFKQNGYEPMYEVPESFRSAFINYGCEYFFNKYENGDRKYHIDVHWLAYHPSFDLPKALPNEMLFSNPATIKVSGKDVQVLNTDNHFITLILHHGLRESWAALKYLLDIAQIVKNGKIDWAYQRQMSTNYQYNKVLNTGLALVDDLLGITADTEYNIETGYYTDLILSGKPRRRSFFRKQMRKISLIDNPSGRLKVLLKTIRYSFAPSKLDYDFVKLPKSLFFLYIFVKAFRLGFAKKEIGT